MDWDSWIGQDLAPDLPPEPPKVLDDVTQAIQIRQQSLISLAQTYFDKSPDFQLPTPASYVSYEEKGIELEPELIEGVFRQGHKLMVSGASKSGKSFMLIELALCLASGQPWLGYKCKECKVLYVNLEISEPSFAHRIECVSSVSGIDIHSCDQNLKIVNLRGTSVSLGKMSAALIGTIIMEEANTGVPFSAIILDPIYKISNGEENSAKDVGDFCHELDKIAAATGASVIYSHHHSKGDQGYKSAQDRASGSGVFARDADAMIDMIELDIDKETYLAMRGAFACNYWIRLLDENFPGWRDGVDDDALDRSGDLAAIYQKNAHVSNQVLSYLNGNIDEAFEKSMKGTTPIRIEFTLREFASPEPINVFFRYPVHVLDETGCLAAADPKSHIQGQKREKVKSEKKTKEDAFYEALVQIITEKGFATKDDLMAKLKKRKRTIESRLRDIGDEFVVETGGGNRPTKIYFRQENFDEREDV